MIIVKHPDTYQCSVCLQEYKTQFLAEYCESNVLVPISKDILVGDKVLIQTRYNGYFEDKVTNIFVEKQDVYKHLDFDEELDNFLPKINMTYREYMLTGQYKAPHVYVIETEREWNVCNDGSCSKLWYESEVIQSKHLRWNNDNSSMVGDVLIKYVEHNHLHHIKDNNVEAYCTIRRGDNDWYETYWKDKSDFIAFAALI